MPLIIDLLHDPIIYDLSITDSVKEVKSWKSSDKELLKVREDVYMYTWCMHLDFEAEVEINSPLN